MSATPQYVIVHRRVRPHVVIDQVYDVDPDDSLVRIQERAVELQSDVEGYERLNDSYRVAELRYVDREGR